jgi:hypothetical protein
MSLNVVGSLDLNVDRIDKWNCEISHKRSKDYVKKPTFIVQRRLSVTVAYKIFFLRLQIGQQVSHQRFDARGTPEVRVHQ